MPEPGRRRDGGASVLLDDMKNRLMVLLLLVSALLMLTGAAYAVEDPVAITMQISNSTFTQPAEIDVSIQISNTSDADLPGPMTLYYPSGEQVEDFGTPTLAAGTSASWTGKWTVTQEELEAGVFMFKLSYSITGDEGEVIKKLKGLARQVTYEGGVASIEVVRTIMPTTAGEGQQVSVNYSIINTGTLPISNLVITESSDISSSTGKIAAIAAGEKASYTFTATMKKKNLTSQATITYDAGGKSHTSRVESATVKYGVINLKGTLTADKKGGVPGDVVKLTLTLKNSGKTDYTNVTVSDAVLGELFSGQTVPAGKSVTLEKEVTVVDTVDYQLVIRGTDTAGDEIETATERVTITAVEPSQVPNLQVELSVDRDTIYTLPGIVKFTTKVTNLTTADMTNVSVKAGGMTLYTFPTLLAGETRSFVRDVKVETTGKFQFTALVVDQLKETQTFESNIVTIQYALPTAEPTEVPIAVPVEPSYEPLPTEAVVPAWYDTASQVLRIAMIVLGALAGVAALLALAGIIRRITFAAGRSGDRLDQPSIRDYEQANGNPDAYDSGDSTPTPPSDNASEAAPAGETDGAQEALKADAAADEHPFQRRRRTAHEEDADAAQEALDALKDDSENK